MNCTNYILYTPRQGPSTSAGFKFPCPLDNEDKIRSLFSHLTFKLATQTAILRACQPDESHSFSQFISVIDRSSQTRELIELHDFKNKMPKGFFFKVQTYPISKEADTWVIKNLHLETRQRFLHHRSLESIEQIPLDDSFLRGQLSSKQKEPTPLSSSPQTTKAATLRSYLVALPHDCILNPETNIILHKKLRFKLSSECLLGLQGKRDINHNISLDLISIFLKKHSKKFLKEPTGDREYSEYLCVTSNGNKKILNGVISFFLKMQSPEELPIFIIKTAYFANEWQLKNRFGWQTAQFDLWKTQICQFNADQIPKK